MDNLTHTLIGVGLAESGLSRKWGRGTTTILAISSNLPDVDVVFLLGGPLSFLWRRTISHSVVGTVILALLASWIFKKVFPTQTVRQVLVLTGLGVVSHVFADLWNAYGVVLFWPFNWERIDFSWVFIIDLMLWGALFGTLGLSFFIKNARTILWRVSLIICSIYIGICSWARHESASLLGPFVREHGARSLHVYPEPLGPTRFRGVLNDGEQYWVYQVTPFEKNVRPMETIKIQDDNEVVRLARESVSGQKLDWFFSTPVWRLSKDQKSAIVYGLGFVPTVLKIGNPFVFHVTKEGDVFQP